MIRTMIQKIKAVMYRMGLIKGIKKLSDHKEISIDDEMYGLIEMYKELYRGYHEPWHRVKYQTLDGPKERKMDTINMAKASAAEMASLVFNERCDISIGNDENPTSEFVDDVLKKNKFNKKFQDFLEFSFSLGGMVAKPYVENGEIKLSFVTADCFIPLTWSNGTITEGVFVNETFSNGRKYTLLEWHTWEKGVYTVTNELYESTGTDDLGTEVPLSTLDIYRDLEPFVGMKKIKKHIFVYFKPNTANNIDIHSPLGIPLFANALSTMKSLDTAFDSFHREFRLGKKRIIVPEAAIKTVADPTTGNVNRYFDSNDETYEAFNVGGMDDDKIHDISVELRVSEHIAAINALLNLFAMQTGFSAGTFTFDGESMKTATEVISEQSKTFKSKQSHEIIIESGLIELIESILAIADQYNLFTSKDDIEISVAFDDSIAEDKATEINKQVQLVQAELQSKKRAIVKIFGVTDDEALEIIKEIDEEQKRTEPEERESVLFGDRE